MLIQTKSVRPAVKVTRSIRSGDLIRVLNLGCRDGDFFYCSSKLITRRAQLLFHDCVGTMFEMVVMIGQMVNRDGGDGLRGCDGGSFVKYKSIK